MEDIFVYSIGKNPEEVIEGLKELRAAKSVWVKYHIAKAKFERGECEFEDVPAYNPREVDDLGAKFPRAAAFLEAERWSFTGTPIKVRLGTIACERLLNGEDPDTVLNDMSRGLDAFYMAQEG